MKLLSYGPFGEERAGILVDDAIVDIEDAMRELEIDGPVNDMRLLLEKADWRSIVSQIARHAGWETIDPSTVRLGAPVPVPRKFLIAGANTYSHLAEAGPVVGDISPPVQPMILAKATSCISGPYDEVVLPPETKKLDYEVELGVVIGRKGRRIKREEARDYIAGFLAINEMSARDHQLAEHENNPFYRVHFLGKSFDTFAPMGPYLVTADELNLDAPFHLRTTVDGQVRQDNDTSDLVFGFEELVSYASQFMTLFPGDIFATGSPAGVGHFMSPPGYLHAGDVVRCEVSCIGAIENTVVSE